MADAYFLSDTNPVATTDQRDLEARALALMEHPELQRARRLTAHLWREAVAWPCREQMDGFEGMITELAFWHALFAANGDGGDPHVLRVMEPPLRSFARDLPGSRWGGDCPDFVYRMIPITADGSYEVTVEPSCAEPPMVNYALMGASMSPPANLAVVDGRALVAGEDGSYTLTLGPTAAEGLPNHIQTQQGSHHLLVRDALGDWIEQTPSRLHVRRLDPPSTRRSDDDLASEAARRLMETCFFAYYTTRSANAHAANILSAPASSGPAGGMPSQASCKGQLELADDEAMIVTVEAGGALYRNVQLNDVFFRSLDYHERLSSLNMRQMAADADGRFTYVVAHHDPGVHNWLDTGGRRQLLFGHRWQHFSEGGTGAPSIAGTVVKFAELESALPEGIVRVSAAERDAQVAARHFGYERRLEGR